jgi:hypothetical protein
VGDVTDAGPPGEESLDAVHADADEIRRRAEAAADLIRSEADRYAHDRRVAADRMHEQARRQLVLAEEECLARRSAAEMEATAIVGQAVLRARQESDALLEHARRRLADAVEQTRPARKLPLLGRQDLLTTTPAPSASIIDLRSRSSMPHPAVPVADDARTTDPDDPLSAIVEEAVSNAVRRTMRPPGVRAGRYV